MEPTRFAATIRRAYFAPNTPATRWSATVRFAESTSIRREDKSSPKVDGEDPKATVANVPKSEIPIPRFGLSGANARLGKSFSPTGIRILLALRVHLTDGIDDETWLIERDVL